MKKIMSVIMIAIMAICSCVVLNSCGDDDDDAYDTKPSVSTTEYQISKGSATITGKIMWNGNKSSKDAVFVVWGSTHTNKVEYKASSSSNDVFTTLTAKVDFTLSNGNVTANIYDPGETVYYQAVIKNVKYGKGTEDVVGNTMNFIVQ